jgi:DNA/RNA endonuclease G (NUC1)
VVFEQASDNSRNSSRYCRRVALTFVPTLPSPDPHPQSFLTKSMNTPIALRPSCRKMSVTGIAGALLLIIFSIFTLQASSPSAGDLMLLVAAASASNTTGSVVEINTSTAGQTASQTIALPDTSNTNDSYRMSGSATSTGYVALSNDRSLLAITGHNSTNTSANANTLNPRGVYTIDAFGAVLKQTTYTGGSGNQTRGATTLNGTTWFIADQGGLYTNGSTGASPSGNFRAAKSFGGVVYIGQQSSSTGSIQVSAISAASGGTLTGLPGLTNNASFQDFYLAQSGANGATYDLLYVVSDTSATAGTIAKYSLVSGSWTANGSYTTTFGGFGLAAAAGGSGAILYVTTGGGATTANSVIKVTDAAGYNAAINVTTANNVTLYTAPAGTIIKGLDFAPLSGASVGPSISQNPQSQTIASGQTATLTVVASGTAPLTYQWYQGAAGVTTTPVGTNSSSFTTPALTATTSYWARVTNSQGSADSTAATITVGAQVVAPSISQNPQSQTIASGQTATLTVAALGTAPLSYQWYQGATGVTTTPVGTNSPSFTTPALTATTSYWARVSNAGGFADSAAAVITVNAVSTPPSGTGSAVLSAVPAGGTTQLTVNVTPGTNPVSTNITVTGDLSAIGGSNAQTFSGSGNTFSFLATVDAATTPGSKTLPITVSDAQGRSTGFNISLTVTAPLANSTIVISQIYGGGGNSGALYTNDFVQLYNRGNTTVDTSGWSLQYAPATGTGDWTGRQPLGGLIAPGQYYLIALASGGTNGSALPAANVTGQINISQTAGKIALVDNGDLLTGPAGCAVSTHIQDLVGYGATADCWEGTGVAAVSGALTTTALFRLGSGSIDTNDNKADFSTAAPAPLSTAPIVQLPPQVFTTYPTTNDVDTPRDATIEVSFTAAVTLDSAWFDITCATTGSHNSATEAPDGINRWITPNMNFIAGEQCTVTVFHTKVHDAATGALSPSQDYTWSFTVASGAAPPETASVHLLMGNPTGAVTDVNQPNNYLMSKPEYAMSYNRSLGRPNWVSWHLTNAWIPLSHPARVDTFRPDPAVPADWYRVQSFDFSGSGFDRGHMTPNADREDTLPDNQATFLMSNMVAQSPDNNQGPWADFENYLRSLVRSSPANEVYIVSGPVGTGGTGSNGASNTVAGGNVTVPASTWKVALVLPDNGTSDDISRVTCAATTVAVIMPNVQGIRSNPWTTYLTTVNAVETLTGYHFFTNLPQPIQNCVKAGTNGVNPKNDQTISFAALGAAAVGGSVPLQATASSGLAVTLTVTSGPATIVNGTTLHVTGAGLVTVQATQPGDVNYNPAPPVSQSLQVTPASQTIAFNGSAPTPTYGAPAFQVSATGGPSGNPVTFSAAGACSVVSQPGVATVTIVSAGVCTLTASQAGNADYNAAPNAIETILIAKATATITVSGATFGYDGNPHGLTGTASGVLGEDLGSLLTLGSSFTNTPGGRASWSFAGNTNYLPSNGSALVTITQAGAPVVSFIPGNLVVAVEGNGVAGAGAGPYTDNQASPLTLFQYAPNGTASATYVNSLVLPQTGSGANLAVSSEYGSSSEGTLHLSGFGHYLTIAGYGINAAAFNANPALYGTDPSKPTALAQSGSLTGAAYTPVPRVVALIDPYGNVNSSTGLYNVFNTNNPRSVYTDDGMNLYISGQGTGNDLTGGVFYATLGSSSATAITGATANSNNPPPATIAQDTRDVQIFGGQLYAAIDTKEGTGSNRDYIGTLGPAGGPPTAAVGAPVRLPGFGNNGGTGKLTISPASTNGINSNGQEINLSPVGYFFANATTLYVADSGQPKNDSVTNDSNGVTLGNGGLQKWVFSSGTWSLAYTLGLQNGLPLVTNTSPAGVTGLYGLTGKVVGGDVLLYATTYSINDLDQTFLFGISDALAATTNPGASFKQLAIAPADSNFKGVAFAPAAPSGSVTITSSPSGMAFTSAGTGCAPGNYTTPATLIWTPGSDCTLSAPSPQAGATGIQYQLHQWEDGSTSTTHSVKAPTFPTVYSVSFDTYCRLTTSASAGGSVSAGGFVLSGTNAVITATPAAGYGFTNWTGNVASANNPSTTITMNAPQSVTANFHALVKPAITWPTPADIVFGTELSASQLNATTNVAGSFSYTPPAGTVLNAGSGQTLSTTFTPSDTNNYTAATATVSISVSRLNATLSLSGLARAYDGAPKPVSGTVSPLLCGVAVTYNGSTSAPVFPGTYAVVASVTNPNCAGAVNGTLTIFVSGVVRHAPSLNGGVHGSLQILLPESFALNAPANVTGDLLVPGTPTVKLNSSPMYGGTIDGPGSASPSGQTITLNGSTTVNHIVRRIDPAAVPAVSAPPAPTGTRDVALNSPGQDPGSFSTIRNLTLNGNVGQVAVPPGTYGNLSANTNSGFTLGVPGATTPAVYNFQQLVVNGNAHIEIAGPVVITVANGVNLNGAAGVAAHPEWLSLSVFSGGVTLNGAVSFYGYVTAASGGIVINGSSALHGGVIADSLTVNGGGLLDLISQ